MNINTLKKAILTGVLSLAVQVSAQAITVEPNITTQFLGVSASPGTTYYSATSPGVTTLMWKDGNCGTCSANRIRFDSLGPNYYSNLPGADIGSPFTLGVLRFRNLTDSAASGLESAQLNLSVLLWDTMLDPINLVFDLTVQQTANTSQASDLLSITHNIGSYTFNTAEGYFRLDILGWSNDRGDSLTDTLTVADNRFDGLRLYGVVTSVNTPVPSSVPVPAAAWLFGSGLLGLTAVARRRQQT